MKFFSYILTLLLTVNIYFMHGSLVDLYNEDLKTECTTMCCPGEREADEESKQEKPVCCSDAYCTIVIASAHAMNYNYSPEIPKKAHIKEFLPLVYTYTNLYTSSHIYDFWNPPKV